MTREEAIKFLTLMRNALNNFKEYGHDKASMIIDCDKAEAFDVAIEALSERNIARDIATILENEQDMRVMLNLVRCKDCRWWNSETNGCKRNPSVEAWYETDFCKYGERREP